MAAGAVVAAVGGGIALSRAGKLNLQRHKRFLGVPMPKRTTFGKAAKQIDDAVASVSNLADGKSPIKKLTDDLPVIGGDSNGQSRISKVLDKVMPG